MRTGMNYEWATDGVRKEATGWRDNFIGRWHRTIGYDAASQDLDAIVTDSGAHEGAWLEYYNWQPKALIEYKTIGAFQDVVITKGSPEKALSYLKWKLQAMTTLATMAGLPAYLVIYDETTLKFAPRRLNQLGADVPQEKAWMSELGYARFLYLLRGVALPEEVAARLSDQ
jgi:hypothetical protein